MSSMSQEIREIEVAVETAALEHSRSTEESLSQGVLDTQKIMKEVDPDILEKYFDRSLLEHLDEGQMHLLAYQISSNEVIRRQIREVELKMGSIPREVAKETLCNPNDTRWLGDTVLRAVVGLGVTALVQVVAPKVINAVKSKKSDPFADIMAAPSRPRMSRSSGSNVTSIFASKAS